MRILQEQFGQIDIYLFDQLLKGRISPGMRILDAGCGSGRNIFFLLRAGYDVCATDADADESMRPRSRDRSIPEECSLKICTVVPSVANSPSIA